MAPAQVYFSPWHELKKDDQQAEYSGFLHKLSPEVRLKIYECVLVDNADYCPKRTALLCTSRSVYEEAMPVLYGRRQICIEITPGGLTALGKNYHRKSVIDNPYMVLVHRIAIVRNYTSLRQASRPFEWDLHMKDQVRTIANTIAGMSSLRELTILINIDTPYVRTDEGTALITRGTYASRDRLKEQATVFLRKKVPEAFEPLRRLGNVRRLDFTLRCGDRLIRDSARKQAWERKFRELAFEIMGKTTVTPLPRLEKMYGRLKAYASFGHDTSACLYRALIEMEQGNEQTFREARQHLVDAKARWAERALFPSRRNRAGEDAFEFLYHDDVERVERVEVSSSEEDNEEPSAAVIPGQAGVDDGIAGGLASGDVEGTDGIDSDLEADLDADI